MSVYLEQHGLPGLTGVAVEAGVVPKAKVGAGVDVDAPKPLPNDIPVVYESKCYIKTLA